MSTNNITIEDLRSRLADNDRVETSTYIRRTVTDTRRVSIGGSVYPVSMRELHKLHPNYYFGNVFKNWDNKPVIVLSIGLPYDGAYITKASYTLTNNSSSVQTTGTVDDFKTLNTNSESIKLLLFNDGIIHSDGSDLPDGKYTLSGTITLDDESTLTLAVTSLHYGENINSQFEGKFGTGTNADDDLEVPLYGVSKLGIADFRKVEQEVKGYVPGEISHIENVMASEYKEKFSRKLTSTETTSETSSEREIENQIETSISERNELQSEISKVLNEDAAANYGSSVGVQGKIMEQSFSANAFANYSQSSAKSESNTQAQNYAQDVTERAVDRITEKVNEKRASRIYQEYEEHNKHGFDNTGSQTHVRGIYQWVDKIYTNKLINYGKRLMYEFSIPEPAKYLKEAIFRQVDNDFHTPEVIAPEPPKTLESIGLISPRMLDKGNYQDFAKVYNAEVKACPEEDKLVSKAINYKVAGDNAKEIDYSLSESVDIPKGYKAKYAKITGGLQRHNTNEDDSHAMIAVGNKFYKVIEGKVDHFMDFFGTNVEDELGVAIRSRDIGTLAINVVVGCILKESEFKQWQNETYHAIASAYQKQLDAYNRSKLEEVIQSGPEKEKIQFNPKFNRSLEKKEIKRISIDLLTAPFKVNVSRDNYVKNSATTVAKTLKFEEHASVVKFFEQAFDWELMAYMFYPYFYAKKGDWTSLFQTTDGADPIFQAFLQSGMARAVVPVRPGFEEAVNWYMATGQVWYGKGLAVSQDDDLFLSIADEMQTYEGELEETWETRVPTALTILQAQNQAVGDDGLPIYEESVS